MFYWSLGRDLDAIKGQYEWGSGFYRAISEDIKHQTPDVKSFSPRNLLYMHRFIGFTHLVKLRHRMWRNQRILKMRHKLWRTQTFSRYRGCIIVS